MYVSKLKIVFVHIPKCAGTSVERCLLQVSGLENDSLTTTLLQKNRNPFKGPPSLGHLRAKDYVSKGHMTQNQWNSAFKFTIVRNPLARLVSIYNYRALSWRARALGKKSWSFREFVLNYFPAWYDENYIKGHDNWTHAQPIWKMLYDSKGEKLLVDYVGKLENLNEDFKTVCLKAGLAEITTLPRENPSSIKNPTTGEILPPGYSKPHWSSYYDEDTLSFAVDFYKRDFELFGYDPASVNLS